MYERYAACHGRGDAVGLVSERLTQSATEPPQRERRQPRRARAPRALFR